MMECIVEQETDDDHDNEHYRHRDDDRELRVI